MTDRRRRAALRRHPLPLLLPLPADGGPALLLRERGGGDTEAPGAGAGPSEPGAGSPGSGPGSGGPGASGASGGTGASGGSGASGASDTSADDNPFAPPPEGRPDQPWQPRKPAGGTAPPTGDSTGASGDSPSGHSGWGSQWSNRQPPSGGNGGFGGADGTGRAGGPGGTGRGQKGPDNSEGGPGANLRWDPTDPAQRRARYALLAGMWAFFFALFTQREISLLLGALALYWGISSLRNRQPKPDATAALTGAPATPAAPPANTRPQTTAAVSGLVTAVLALVIVATTFTVQLVYRDYYTCVADSLTQSAQVACNDELPKSLVPVFGVKE